MTASWGGSGSGSSRLGGGGLDPDPLPPNHTQAAVERPLYDVKLPTCNSEEPTIVAVAKRLGSAAEVRAADVLVDLARFAPESVTAASVPFLDATSHVTRLAAEAGVFAGSAGLIPVGLPRQWLEQYLPVQFLILPKRLKEPKSPLPGYAQELQQRTVCLAIGALFRTTTRDEALAVVNNVLPKLSPLLLDDVRLVLRRYNASDLVEPLVDKHFESFRKMMPSFNQPNYREELVALLDAISHAVGSPDDSEDVSLHTLPLLSRVLGALGFWELEGHRLGERKDQESLELIVSRVVRGMRIDREALQRELASGYRISNALTPRGIYAHVRPVAVHVDWGVAAAEPIAPDQLRRALIHPCDIVVWAAAELLESGAARGDGRAVIAGALEDGRLFTCFAVAQVAPTLIGVEAAADVVRNRLRRGNDHPRRLRGIFLGLAMSARAWGMALYADIYAALMHSNSFVAEAAADALESMCCPCTPEYVAALRKACRFWLESNGWCERCDLEVVGQCCGKCRIGVQFPLAALVRELVRCAGLSEEELRPLASHAHSDVKDAANKALAALASK